MPRRDSPRLAPIPRLVNRIARPLAGRVILDVPTLVDRAAETMGRGEIAGFAEPLERLLHGLNTEARLSLIGRAGARQYLVETIRNRWRLDRWRPRDGSTDEALVRPLIVVGLPRTGTTFLHQLLALAPGARAPLGWEAARAVTPESPAVVEDIQRRFDRLHRMMPALERIHPMGARVPQECVALMAYDLMSPQFHFTWRVPSYADWLAEQSMVPVYRAYRRSLQAMLALRPGSHLVLKSPCHLPTLDALLEVFPDACIVHTLRAPLKAIPSGASLVWHLRSTFSDVHDLGEIGRDYLERWSTGARAAIAVHREVDPARWLDVHYGDLVADPVGTVRGILTHFGRPPAPGHESAIGRFVERDRKTSRRHRYTPATFGLDRAAIGAAMAPYVDHFGIRPDFSR